jgi:2-polyprenyl-3-methyl-5-hydroxy-6-metoxy-1,4-benzoquinol methylase
MLLPLLLDNKGSNADELCSVDRYQERAGCPMTTPRDDWTFPEITDDTVRRYRDNYYLPHELPVTRLMVQQHMELEYGLKEVLLNSAPDARAAVWAECYDKLYRDLPWLADAAPVDSSSMGSHFGHFLKLIPRGSRVIEIGSGVGLLAKYLTKNERPCVATEITGERGIREDGMVVWHSTDGVHLDEFESQSAYDVVLSTQVVEHLHPDDIERHFEGALALLRPGGIYILETPHAFLGPADLSRVFSLDQPRFMHLKEYTHRELGTVALRAGFRKLSAVYLPPTKVRRRFPILLRGRWLYTYLSLLEKLQQHIRLPRMVLRALLFHGNAFMIATR